MKAVIFDCDGVLVDSEFISTGVFGKMLRERKVDIEDDYIYKSLKGGSIHESLAFVKQYLPNADLPALEKEYRQRSYAAFSESLVPIAGIKSLLQKLKLPRAVASNGPKEKILLNLNTTGLITYFNPDLIFSAHDIQLFKPNPSLFLHAADKLGYPPSDCVVIEDSAHGAKAAQKAGMICYGFCRDTDPGDFTRYGAQPIDDISELEQILLH